MLVTLLLTIPAASSFLLWRDLHELVAEHLLAPPLEACLGFEAERVLESSSRGGPFRITRLVQDGPFALAGFRVGDIPVSGFMHGTHADSLFGALWAGRGREVTVPVQREEGPIRLRIRVPHC